jgi:hypothetical protein
MRIVTACSLAALLVVADGCSSGSSTTPDSNDTADVTDSALDDGVAPDDAAPDAVPDTAPDTAPDTEPDAPPDVGPDGDVEADGAPCDPDECRAGCLLSGHVGGFCAADVGCACQSGSSSDGGTSDVPPPPPACPEPASCVGGMAACDQPMEDTECESESLAPYCCVDDLGACPPPTTCSDVVECYAGGGEVAGRAGIVRTCSGDGGLCCWNAGPCSAPAACMPSSECSDMGGNRVVGGCADVGEICCMGAPDCRAPAVCGPPSSCLAGAGTSVDAVCGSEGEVCCLPAAESACPYRCVRSGDETTPSVDVCWMYGLPQEGYCPGGATCCSFTETCEMPAECTGLLACGARGGRAVAGRCGGGEVCCYVEGDCGGYSGATCRGGRLCVTGVGVEVDGACPTSGDVCCAPPVACGGESVCTSARACGTAGGSEVPGTCPTAGQVCCYNGRVGDCGGECVRTGADMTLPSSYCRMAGGYSIDPYSCGDPLQADCCFFPPDGTRP